MRTKFFLLWLISIFTSAIGATAWAQDGAKLAPADAIVFMQLDDLAGLRKELVNDPLAKLLSIRIEQAFQSARIDDIRSKLQMTGSDIIDRYVGKSVVLVVCEVAPRKTAWILFTKVGKEDSQLAIEKLGLQSVGDCGTFKLYGNRDGKARIAFNGEWMALADAAQDKPVRAILTQAGGEKSLASNETFRLWMSRLPADKRAITAYLHIPDWVTPTSGISRIPKKTPQTAFPQNPITRIRTKHPFI